MTTDPDPPQSQGGPARRLAVGAGGAFLGRSAHAGLKFGTQVAVSRLLGLEAFGLYALAMVIAQIAELFGMLGLETGAVRYIAIYRSSGEEGKLKGVLHHILTLPFVLGLVSGGAIFLGADGIAAGVFDKPGLAGPLRIFAATLPFGATMSVLALGSTGFGVTRYLAYVWTAQPGLSLCLVVLFCGLAGAGVNGAALAWFLATVVTAVLAVGFLRALYPPLFDRRVRPEYDARQLLWFSIPLALGSFLWLLMLWTDIMLLGYYRSAEEVGIYRAASQTAMLLSMIVVSLNTILSPTIAELYDQGETAKLQVAFRTATRWSFLLTLPLLLVLTIAADDVLQVFGAGFGDGSRPLVLLCSGFFAGAATGGSGEALVMSGHARQKVAGDFLFMVINIALNVALIPRWGLLGAAVATSISLTGMYMLRLVQACLILRLWPYNWGYLKPIAAGAAAAVAAVLLRRAVPLEHFAPSLMLTAAMISLVYAGVLAACGLETEDRDAVSGIMRRLRPGTEAP